MAACGSYLVFKIQEVSRTLEYQYNHCEIAGILIQLGTAAFALTLHLLEARQDHAKELYHDGCSNVRHDAECKD
ncbi:unknown [Prevotella sp. CAG:485]|nr:unknown [Prevotella sp. CAG:485]